MKVTLFINSSDSLEIDHSDLSSIINVLSDKKSNAHFISSLRNHPVSEIRRVVADNPYMGIDTLKYLARDKSIRVVRSVADNNRALTKFKSSLLLEMISRDVSVAKVIALSLGSISKKTCNKIIPALLQHTDPAVVEIAQNYTNYADQNEDEFTNDEEITESGDSHFSEDEDSADNMPIIDIESIFEDSDGYYTDEGEDDSDNEDENAYSENDVDNEEVNDDTENDKDESGAGNIVMFSKESLD